MDLIQEKKKEEEKKHQHAGEQTRTLSVLCPTASPVRDENMTSMHDDAGTTTPRREDEEDDERDGQAGRCPSLLNTSASEIVTGRRQKREGILLPSCRYRYPRGDPPTQGGGVPSYLSLSPRRIVASSSQAFANASVKASNIFHRPNPDVACITGTCWSKRVSYPDHSMYLTAEVGGKHRWDQNHTNVNALCFS